MTKRKRNATLTIRLTDIEKKVIRNKAVRAGMSLTDFIIVSALHGDTADCSQRRGK